eukprot:3614818-Alexandrium_andersonii.AAC.1
MASQVVQAMSPLPTTRKAAGRLSNAREPFRKTLRLLLIMLGGTAETGGEGAVALPIHPISMIGRL